jgi:hypothetical protein
MPANSDPEARGLERKEDRTRCPTTEGHRIRWVSYLLGRDRNRLWLRGPSLSRRDEFRADLSPARAIDVSGGKAGIIARKLNIDRGEFRWLPGPTEDGRAAR